MMDMTPVQRCEVVREIRTVLVRHYLDLGLLQFSLNGHTASISGVLERIPGAESRLSPQIVDTIIHDLRNIHLVSAVFAEFDNWKQNEGLGGWVEVKRSIAVNADVGENVLTVKANEDTGGRK